MNEDELWELFDEVKKEDNIDNSIPLYKVLYKHISL